MVIGDCSTTDITGSGFDQRKQMRGAPMKCGRIALALICIGAISSTAGLASAQTRSEPLDKASRQVRQDVKRQQLEMNQNMRRTQADMDRLRRDMDNQARSFRALVSTLRHTDLLYAGAGLMRGAVLRQSTLPKASLDLRPPVTTGAVRAAPPLEMGRLTVGALAGSALPTAGIAFQTANAVSALWSAYLVGTGRATPDLLRPIVPHITFACDRLGTPIDFRGTGNLEWSTPIGHSELGVSHRIRDWSVRTEVRHDPLTNRLITTHRTYSVSEFRMNGGQWNRWYRNQITNPSMTQPLPRLQTMPRMNTYTLPMRTYTPPMRTYTPPMRTYSPPPRIQ